MVMGLLVIQGESIWGLRFANATAVSSVRGVLVAEEMEDKAQGCDLWPDCEHTYGLPLCTVRSWGFAVRFWGKAPHFPHPEFLC